MANETWKIAHLVGTSAQGAAGGGRKGLLMHDTDAATLRMQLDAGGSYAFYARRDAAQTFRGVQTFQDGVVAATVKVTGHAGTGPRMVQAAADGTQSAVDAATARTTLGAQAALGYTPVNKAGDTMTGGLTLSAGNLNVGAGAIQTAGVTRISNDGAGSLTTLTTTGLATLQSLNIPSLTGSRMLSLDASKNVQSLDASGSRTLLGVDGAEEINRKLKTIVTPGWVRLCTLTTGAVAVSATVDAVCVSLGRGSLSSDRSSASVYARLKDTGSGVGAFEVTVEYVLRGTATLDFGYVVDSDDGTTRVVTIWVRGIGSTAINYSILGSGVVGNGSVVFYEMESVVTTQPTGYVAGTLQSLAAGATTLQSLKVTAEAGSGGRLVQAGADGTQSASIPVPSAFAQTLLDDADAATARATIGVKNTAEAVSVTKAYADLPSPAGYALLNDSAFPVIPANALTGGTVIRLKAGGNFSVPDYADLVFGLSTNSGVGAPTLQTGFSIGVAGGPLPDFTSGKVLISCEMYIGAVTSGSTRRVHFVISVTDVATNTTHTYFDENRSIDTSLALYPHIAIDLANSGSITRYFCTSVRETL